jgi:hypothetical protein
MKEFVFFLWRVNTFGENAAVGGQLGRVWSGGGHHARSRAHHHHGLHNLATEIGLGQHLVLQNGPTHNLEGRLQQARNSNQLQLKKIGVSTRFYFLLNEEQLKS